MKKLTKSISLLFAIFFTMNFAVNSQTAITQDNIHSAVDLWLSNEMEATSVYGPISTWDVSNVTNMSQLFFAASNFNDDISQWDVSSVTNMSRMFHDASVFSVDISGWDVSSVTNMYNMFLGTFEFQVDLNNWDVSNVTNMSSMFTYSHYNGDISGWDVSNVTNMESMFAHNYSFNQDISGWNTESLSNATGMFTNAGSFNQDISGWDVSNFGNLWNIFSGCPINFDLSSWNIINVGAIRNVGGGFSTETRCAMNAAWSELNDNWVVYQEENNWASGCVSGCTDSSFLEYSADANTDDGSCETPVISGCTDATAFNYAPSANTEDGSCVPVVNGCTDVTAFNYSADANTDDGSCVAVVNGCTDVAAFNYSTDANTDDGSCISWEEYALDLEDQLNTVQAELDGTVIELAAAQTAAADAAYAAATQLAFLEGEAMMLHDMLMQEQAAAADAAQQAYAEGVASVEIPECEEVVTQNMPLDLPQGWSMFGYTCLESLDVISAFSGVSDNIEIVKDEWGLAYIPTWGFSAFDNLEFGEGYQIKMIEEVTDFQFCSTIVGTSSQE